MGYWIYTPEQGERIRAGDKTARDQFFWDNYKRISDRVRYRIRNFPDRYREINDYLNAVYIDLSNWRYDNEDRFLDYIKVCVLKTRLNHREYDLMNRCYPLPEVVSLYQQGGKNDDEFCIADMYLSEEIELPNDTLTPDAIALFFLPFFKNKKYTDMIYHICLGCSIREACTSSGFTYDTTKIERIRKVFFEHFDEFLDFTKRFFPGSYFTLVACSDKINEARTLNDERRKARNARALKRSHERKKAQAV